MSIHLLQTLCGGAFLYELLQFYVQRLPTSATQLIRLVSGTVCLAMSGSFAPTETSSTPTQVTLCFFGIWFVTFGWEQALAACRRKEVLQQRNEELCRFLAMLGARKVDLTEDAGQLTIVSDISDENQLSEDERHVGQQCFDFLKKYLPFEPRLWLPYCASHACRAIMQTGVASTLLELDQALKKLQASASASPSKTRL